MTKKKQDEKKRSYRPYTCILVNERRVRYNLLMPDGNKRRFYYVVFTPPEGGKPRQLSTKELNAKLAHDAAQTIIRQTYSETPLKPVSWDEAIDGLKRHMKANNNRRGTVKSYVSGLNVLRNVFPGTCGPQDINARHAKEYKVKMAELGREPTTIAGHLNRLTTIWGVWFMEEMGIVPENPWLEVEWPKVDKRKPRRIQEEELDLFVSWMKKRYLGWRLPLLFLEVKAAVGCRIGELAGLPKDGLKEGRIVIECETAKGRKTRRCLLPPGLYMELCNVCGKKYVFENFARELRQKHAERGYNFGTNVKEYSPERLCKWLDRQLDFFRQAHPEVPYFKLHNLRGRAMSQAKEAGITYDQAAIAFGCNPETMKKHYIALDEDEQADEVFKEVHRRQTSWEHRGTNGPTPPPPPTQPKERHELEDFFED